MKEKKEYKSKKVINDSKVILFVEGKKEEKSKNKDNWTEEEKEGYLKCGRVEDPLSEVRVYREIGHPLAKILAKTPLTPNHVTYLALMFNVLAGVSLIKGSYLFYLLAVLFLQLGHLLDFVDGSLARIKKMSSLRGAWLDGVTHEFLFLSLFLGLALGLTIHPNVFWQGFFAKFNLDYFYITWIFTIVSLFNFSAMLKVKSTYMKVCKENVKGKFKLPEREKKKGLSKFVKFLFINKPFLVGFFTIGFLVNQAFLSLLIFAVYSSLYLLTLFYYYGKKLNKLESKNNNKISTN